VLAFPKISLASIHSHSDLLRAVQYPRNCCQLSSLVIGVHFFDQPLGTCHTMYETRVKIAFTHFILCASYESSIPGPKERFSSNTVSLFSPNKVPMLLHSHHRTSDQNVFYSRWEKFSGSGSEWTDTSMSRATVSGPISREFSAFRVLAHDVHTSLCAATALLGFLCDCSFSGR